jgi:hypothetical protein
MAFQRMVKRAAGVNVLAEVEIVLKRPDAGFDHRRADTWRALP